MFVYVGEGQYVQYTPSLKFFRIGGLQYQFPKRESFIIKSIS